MILFKSRSFPVRPGQHPDNLDFVGKPLLDWLCGALEGEGAEIVARPKANDHGWTARIDFDDRHFLIGCHGLVAADDPSAGEYTLLVEAVPGWLETLTGGVPLEADDALILTVERLLVASGFAVAPTVMIDG